MPDILIRFDEFPASCDVCPFVGTNDDLMSDDYRYLYCGFPSMGEFVTDYEISRHPDCPLLELPPHGELIDRDAFIAEMKKNDTYQNWLFRKMLEKQPVVVAAERREE